MKIILTTKEVLARFGLPSDVIIELVDEDSVDEGPDSEGWVSNVGRVVLVASDHSQRQHQN